jgi:hypothetical protein
MLVLRRALPRRCRPRRDAAELYQATAPLADRSEAAQTAAFQMALKIVLIRVTGRRSADEDPALAPLWSATRAATCSSTAPRPTINCGWPSTAGHRALADAERPASLGPRAAVHLRLADRANGTAIRHGRHRDDVSELKHAIDAAAAVRGIRCYGRARADLAKNHLDYAAVNKRRAGPSRISGAALGGEGH